MFLAQQSKPIKGFDVDHLNIGKIKIERSEENIDHVSTKSAFC